MNLNLFNKTLFKSAAEYELIKTEIGTGGDSGGVFSGWRLKLLFFNRN